MEPSVRPCHWIVIAALAVGLTALVGQGGCDYSSHGPSVIPEGTFNAGDAAQPAAEPVRTTSVSSLPLAASPGSGASSAVRAPGDEQKAAILGNVIRLIQTAGVKPGGDNFEIAIKNLNQYFAGTPATEYILPPEARRYLVEEGGLPKKQVDDLESRAWSLPDARHVEDCMLYHGIAARIAGAGDDLTRTRRVFDWMVEQVQLVPAGSLAAPGLGQAYARPFDVLLRGMATESEGIWSERGWLFLSLCRQLGLDGGLVTYTPPKAKEPIVWCSAILIEGKPYLFDTRLGLPITKPDGGVATLDDAMTDPRILDRMDLPGQSAYGTTRAALLASPSKIGVLLDSNLHYFTPRMKLLQRSLAGKDLTILYRDPSVQRDRWKIALGAQCGKIGLWELPMLVETLLFTNPEFVRSTQHALFLFRPELPLLYARMKQLRGETSEAIQDYVVMRFAEHPMLMDNKTAMPPDIQEAMNAYSTYFLGLCQLDQKDPQHAQFFFEFTLKTLAAPGGGQPYYHMYRWGAAANLGRLHEAKGDSSKAIAYYTSVNPTSQRHGNLLRALSLVWLDPFAAVPAPLPPSPLAKPPNFRPSIGGAPSPLPGLSGPPLR